MFTTKTDQPLTLRSDLVNERSTADAPRRWWVCDVTYVATWSGFVYGVLVIGIDARPIVGGNVAAALKAVNLPLQALDMAAWDASCDLTRLTRHSDHGSNHIAMVCTDRAVKLGTLLSMGTVGHSYVDALTGGQQPLQDQAVS